MWLLFFVGIVEMIIITAWTKAVSDTKIIASGIITVINIIIWYYVLRIFVENIENLYVLGVYIIGCAIGTMVTTWYYQRREKSKLKTY